MLSELIDTLWNVNMIGTLSPDMGHTIKIETYWNVNEAILFTIVSGT